MFEFEKDKVYVRLVHLVLNSEGHYSNDPDDPGGPTMYGIAWNSNQAAYKAVGITNSSQVRNLTIDQARQIYYNKYYRASGADIIAAKCEKLAYIHFDSAVNHGVGTAAKFLRACRDFVKFKYFEGAGKNADFWNDQFHDFLAARIRFYVQIRKGGGFKKYGGGWMNRMSDILLRIHEMT